MQAVIFVRDLDRGLLGRQAHALEHYERLRCASEALVNVILHVRRLLRQKRTCDSCASLSPAWLFF